MPELHRTALFSKVERALNCDLSLDRLGHSGQGLGGNWSSRCNPEHFQSRELNVDRWLVRAAHWSHTVQEGQFTKVGGDKLKAFKEGR